MLKTFFSLSLGNVRVCEVYLDCDILLNINYYFYIMFFANSRGVKLHLVLDFNTNNFTWT